jgi:hypothetical protein
MVKGFIFASLDLSLGFRREVPALSLSIGELIPGLQRRVGTSAMLDFVNLPVGLGHMIASSVTHTGHTRQDKKAAIRSSTSGGEGSRTPVLKTINPKVYMLSRSL